MVCQQLPASGARGSVSLTSRKLEFSPPGPELRFAFQAPDTSKVPGVPVAKGMFC